VTAARFTLKELRGRPDLTREIAVASSSSEGEVLVALKNLNNRIRLMFPGRNDAIVVGPEGSWKADGVAGLVRLNSSVELEIVPKFLSADSPAWRQDFFVLAVLVKTGHLLHQEELAATSATRDDLATLVAWSLLALYDENSRRPLRSYIPTKSFDFAIDGDVDPESILMPDSDGYSVTRLELTRRNSYNATIAAAAHILIREVADTDTQVRLHRLSQALGHQDAPPRTYRALPQRHHGWSDVYSLSRLVVEGLGLNLDDGNYSGPGFIVSTWEAWESFCEEIVRRALPDHRVVGQKQWRIGMRGDTPVETKPDLSVLKDGKAEFLLDAKYRTRVGKKASIDAGDVYESFAFLHAADVRDMYLLYPSTDSASKLPLGRWFRFDNVELMDNKHVQGFMVQIQGLAQRGGIETIISQARQELSRHAASS
jgi:5-methylcytosine-specific restriction enzyme subunit McrC